MNTASSRDIQWILEKQKFLPWKGTRSNDAREREAIETRVLYVGNPERMASQKPASMSDTILNPWRP